MEPLIFLTPFQRLPVEAGVLSFLIRSRTKWVWGSISGFPGKPARVRPLTGSSLMTMLLFLHLNFPAIISRKHGFSYQGWNMRPSITGGFNPKIPRAPAIGRRCFLSRLWASPRSLSRRRVNMCCRICRRAINATPIGIIRFTAFHRV